MSPTNLLATVLQISYEGFLDPIEFCQLHVNCFAGSLEVLRALSKILPSLDARRSHCKRTLHKGGLNLALGQE